MKDIVPLAYDLKKAKGGLITSDSLYSGMCTAYTGGNIGAVSNNITKIWNSGEIGKEQLDCIKWLCMYNNMVIDFAKTEWKIEPPQDIANIIHSYTRANVPNFFLYAKDKLDEQVAPVVEGTTMARIMKKIPNVKVKYSKTIGKFDPRMLINQEASFLVAEKNKIINSYDYWNCRQNKFNDENDNCKDNELYIAKTIREKICEENKEYDLDTIVNTLVMTLYNFRSSSNKKLLWGCFGDVILNNLKINLKDKGRICPICGKRFPSKGNLDMKWCSQECREEADKERLASRYEAPPIFEFFTGVSCLETVDKSTFFEN